MPYLNLRDRKSGSRKNAPERIPFMKKWNFKEMGCGLHHGTCSIDPKRLQLTHLIITLACLDAIVVLTSQVDCSGCVGGRI